ncbi:MAG: metalloregulator ArsR/SmtB family transcription factor [Dehalobacterium sp.]
MKKIVQVFKALGDETRLKILVILTRKRICAKGIAKHLDISEATVSQHLKILKEAGAIVGQKEGYYVYYNFQESIFQQLVDFIDQMSSVSLETYTLGVNLPTDCRINCKATQGKCCHKNLTELKGEKE